ncbi:c-type cytochrome [Paralcaligenes ureilyticus]|uniref:Cytochrome c n=1 Tax=Paralcaligenes ureilyticus TaxID=627131 RepID=A0A4R3LSF7_9BURK|nr:c-type cytochrome [Paralcaligenes ureilyticus]TCT02746.1 cytochrome c [Paralcaligenes ureilyticus]
MRTFLRVALCIVLAGQGAASWAQDDALLMRGKYLMEGVVACANCHIARDDKGQPLFDKGLSGGMFFDDAAFKAYAPNITPDPETGIGKWTDAQLAKAIREGIRPDGTLIGPPMPVPFYRNLSDSDLAAIIAYLKAQPAIKHQVKKSSYNIPLPPNYGPPVAHVDLPATTNTLKYGEYLANIGHCMDCHTPRNNKGMLVTARLGAGGQVIKWPAGGEAVTPNLTPDESGLKSWSDAQIARAIRDGVDKSGTHLKRIMAFDWYQNIDDSDMKALITYLRSLKPEPFAYAK